MLLDNEIAAEYLTAMYDANMFNGEYAFVTLDFHYDKEWKTKKWFKSQKAFEGNSIIYHVKITLVFRMGIFFQTDFIELSQMRLLLYL